MSTNPHVRRIAAALSLPAVLALVACGSGGGDAAGGGTAGGVAGGGSAAGQGDPVAVSIKSFDSADPCAELREYIAGYADKVMRTRLSEARNSPGGSLPVPLLMAGAPVQSASAPSASAPTAAPALAADSPTFTTTNLQTAGVDELDWMKNDASHVYRLNADGGRSWLTRDRYQPAESIETAGRVDLPTHEAEGGLRAFPRGLFLTESGQAAVLSTLDGYYPVALAGGGAMNSVGFTAPCMFPGCQLAALRQRSHVDIVDFARPGAPQLEGSVEVGGRLIDARRQGQRLWLVTQERFVFPLSIRWWPDNLAWDATGAVREPAFDALIERNAAAIRQTPLADWLPADLAARVGTPGEAAARACRSVRRVSEPTELGWLKIASVNLLDRTVVDETILAEGQTVYASAKSLYITTPNWRAATTSDPGPRTYVHKFEIEPQGAARYAGSGSFSGTPLNSYSFDEDADGQLRFAANDLRTLSSDNGNPTGWEPFSYVGIMKTLSGSLNVTARSAPIAPGERLQSVRFVGPRAYLVTFRTVDPFFVYDMAASGGPQALGELKLPGFSTYLHPVGAQHILGIGYSDGGWPRRIKATLFDVSDPTRPLERSSLSLGDVYSASEALWDPHAFTYRPLTSNSGLMAIPLWSYNYSAQVGESSSVKLVSVSASQGLSLAGQLSVDDLLAARPDVVDAGSLYVRRSILTPDHVFAVGQRLLRSATLAQPQQPLSTLVSR